MKRTILITGGAGYVGAVLVPKLLKLGHQVRVLDLMIYGEDVFNNIPSEQAKNLQVIKGDMRDLALVQKSLAGGVDTVIHLACISNDPSFDLNPSLGKSINLDCFEPLVKASKEMGVKRFIYASSSSVYGIKDEMNVDETMSLEPLTDYSKFKAACEVILNRYSSKDFTTVTIRPATVCGYSPRQRLDVIVNILATHAFVNKKIKVLGGVQKRPNIHIQDMTDLYVKMLDYPSEKINGKIYNVGKDNHTVNDLAAIVKDIYGPEIQVIKEQTNDNRSYHISSALIKKDLGFECQYKIEDAVKEMKMAFEKGLLPNPMEDKRYYNIKTMLAVNLK